MPCLRHWRRVRSRRRRLQEQPTNNSFCKYFLRIIFCSEWDEPPWRRKNLDRPSLSHKRVAEAVAASKATSTIPIVVAVLADPIALGFTTSDARPTGNVTGIMPYVKGLPSKQLELARELVPGATRIGLIDDVTDPKAHPQRQEIEATAKGLEIEIVPAEVRTAADIDAAYQGLALAGVQAVVVEQSNMTSSAASESLAQAAASKRLPTVYGYRQNVDAGGLVSYGVNLDWCNHRAAYYVDKILKGAKPSDLPIEFPTHLELVINLKAAKALGLTVPSSLLVRADEVIE